MPWSAFRPHAIEASVVRALTRLGAASRAKRVSAVVAIGAAALWSTVLLGPDTSPMLGFSVTVALAGWLLATRWAMAAVAVLLTTGAAVLHASDQDADVRWLNVALRLGSLLLVGLITSALRRHIVSIERDVALDPLTQVSSRRAVLTELDAAVAETRRSGITTSVVYFDLDGLKEVNDRAGHRAGDELLAEFSRLVRRRIRPTDVFGRVGGDEFVLLCRGTSAEHAASIVGRIFADGGPDVSWGVATSDEATTADGVLTLADERMYRAKQQRRRTSAPGELEPS